MNWHIEKSEAFRKRLEEGQNVTVTADDWKLIRAWHREMMKQIPVEKLHPWLSLGILLTEIEQGNTKPE